MAFRKYAWPAVCAMALLLVESNCGRQQHGLIELQFITPRDGQRFTPGSIPIKVVWASNAEHEDTLKALVDGGPVGRDDLGAYDTWYIQWDAHAVPTGASHRLKACGYWESRNGATGQDSTSITVRIDTGGPAVRILSPANGDSEPRGMVPIRAWARDSLGGGIDKVVFCIDDVPKGVDNLGLKDTYQWAWSDSQELPGTTHTIKARAYSLHGDISSAAITVRIKTGAHGGPTYHQGQLDTSEMWSPAGNPHIITNFISISQSALLTIMPGCTVELGSQAYVSVLDGGIKAVGRSDAPILFSSNAPTPHAGDWDKVYVSSPASQAAQFQFCTFEYGGSSTSGCEIEIATGNPAVTFDDCTFRRSAGVAIHIQYGGFSSFHNNTITDNRSYPFEVNPQFVPAIGPDNSLVGNDSDGVLIDYGFVRASTTWPAVSAAYVLRRDVAVGDTTSRPVLTIAAGSTLKFKNGATLRDEGGDIIADGTNGWITFTSGSLQPVAGDFGGIIIGTGRAGDSLSNTRLYKCRIEYGGNPNDRNSGDIQVQATVPEISGCEITHSCKWGIVLWLRPVPDTSALKQANYFNGNASGDINWIH